MCFQVQALEKVVNCNTKIADVIGIDITGHTKSALSVPEQILCVHAHHDVATINSCVLLEGCGYARIHYNDNVLQLHVVARW